MTTLIIGAAGRLGGQLSERFPGAIRVDIQRRHGGNDRTADVRNYADMADIFAEAEPSVVYNLAGVVSRVVAEEAQEQALTTNVVGAWNVAHLCRIHGSFLVHVSTSEVYGPRYGAMSETSSVPMPNNWYGMTKWMGEQAVEYVGGRCCIVRPFMLYGETEPTGSDHSAFIRFASSISTGTSFTLHEGTKRGWAHDQDFTDWMEELPNKDCPSVVNLGNPDIRNVSDLIPLMEDTLGKKAQYETVPLPRKMTPVKMPCLDRQKALGFECRVSLEEGVERVCASLC